MVAIIPIDGQQSISYYVDRRCLTAVEERDPPLHRQLVTRYLVPGPQCALLRLFQTGAWLNLFLKPNRARRYKIDRDLSLMSLLGRICENRAHSVSHRLDVSLGGLTDVVIEETAARALLQILPALSFLTDVVP